MGLVAHKLQVIHLSSEGGGLPCVPGAPGAPNLQRVAGGSAGLRKEHLGPTRSPGPLWEMLRG